MNLLVIVGGLTSLIGLWFLICQTDPRRNLPQAVAALLMMFGSATLLCFGLEAPFITHQWLLNGIAALLFGLGAWLAFDRRTQ